jgi:hypothetical protein
MKAVENNNNLGSGSPSILTSSSNRTTYAPGMRIVVRDAQWIVRKADLSADGGFLIECEGLSELVRGKEGRFLTAIENDPDICQTPIKVLEPATTQLVEDRSSNYRGTLLYIESLLRQRVPTDENIHFGHKAAMDPLPFQLDPTLTALKQPRQRILIADAVGLGKTLEAGILMSELMRRGKGKRILVLAVKSMLTQFQKEMWSRFSIPLTRLDSAGLQRARLGGQVSFSTINPKAAPIKQPNDSYQLPAKRKRTDKDFEQQLEALTKAFLRQHCCCQVRLDCGKRHLIPEL